MKTIYFFLALMFIVNLLPAEESPVDTQLPMKIDYLYELIKFYLAEKQYDLALTYLDSTTTHPSDSLVYFKGLALKGKEDWQGSAEYFAQTIIIHRHAGLLQAATRNLKNSLQKISPMESISLLSNYLSGVEDDEVLTVFLFILAEIYEDNQLFEEANDVYQTILKETEYREKVPVKMRIATNQIFLKNYQEAITTLKPIIALNDSIYNENALFFHYLANNSLQNYSTAKKALLRLYLDYPAHQKKEEILKGLAELFEMENQLLMSWYFYQELKNISSDAQKFNVQKEIDRIKQRIGSEKFLPAQFKYFQPIFE